MKKLLKLYSFIIIVMLSFESFPVYANASGETNITVVLDVSEDDSEYDEINEYLIKHGQEILNNKQRSSSITLSGIKRLVQSDPRWSNVIMQTCQKTIGASGCTLTSFAMVRNLLSGTNDTPADINNKLGNAACPFNWEIAKTAYEYTILTKVSNDNGISNESAHLNIIGAIDEYSRPAIVGLKNSSGGTHFVVAHGYTLDGDIIICDPAARNYTRISQYYNAGYFVYRIYVYSK